MNSFGVLADLSEPVDPKDVTFFKFTGLVPDAKVAVQTEPFDTQKYPSSVSLIACASKHGHFAAGTTQGFTFGSTKSLRKAFYSADKGQTVELQQDKITVNLEKAVRQIRFSADESQLLIATEGGVILNYNVADINTNKNNVRPIHTFSLDREIVDLRPNPEALPNLAAVLVDNNQCRIIDITNGNTECELPIDNVTAICWSPKGKQIVCGKLDGSLQHFDTKGASKDNLPIPESMSAGHGEEEENRNVQDVLWVENHIFLVLYARKRVNDEDEYLNDGFIINRKPTNGSNEPLYTRLAEITPIFTTEGRGNHFYMELIRDLGKEIKHLIIIANAATNELSVVGHTEDGEWDTWMLPENGTANLPLSEETSMDTYPLGLALDLSADEKLPPFDASENDTGVEPMPIFYYINDEGHIGSYHCYNIELARRGESYRTHSTSAAATTTAAPATAASTPSAFSSFNTQSNSSFGDLLSGKATSPTTNTSSAFGGISAFGAAAGTSIPSFSNLGSAQKIPTIPASGFAVPNKSASDATVPQFGSTTSFGQAANKPGFGLSTIDKPLSAFGGATKTDQTVPDSKPAGGLFSGMSLGGSKSTTGSVSTTSSGASATTASPAPTSAFGSTSAIGSSGGFGSLAKNTVPGATTPNASPAFGSTSSLGGGGGFGSLAKNTVPGATTPTTTPTFGSTAALGSGGFGSLAKNTVPGATAPTTSPAFGSTATLGGGFGSLAKNTVPGATAPATTPTFGSTATLGSGGFGSLAKNTVPDATAPTFGSTNTFGSGTGFGSLNKPITPPVKSADPSTTLKPAATSSSSAKPTSTSPTISLASPSTTSPSISLATEPASASPNISLASSSTTSPSISLASKTASRPSEVKVTSTPSPPSAEKPKEKLKPTAEEGMAREYESLYIIVCEAIDELSVIHKKIEVTMKANELATGTKTEADLKDKECLWNLNDVADYGALTQRILEKITKDEENTTKALQALKSLAANGKKSMDKKEDIKYLLRKEIDTKVVELMDNRELDAETKDVLKTIQSKSEAYESTLENLESKVQEYKKRNKIKNDHNSGELTLYSLHRAVRDIQRDIAARNNDLEDLEVRLANVKLSESRRRARQSSGGFSCLDISDDEEDEEELGVSDSAIQHTTRYLRRFNFLSEMCEKASARTPLECASK